MRELQYHKDAPFQPTVVAIRSTVILRIGILILNLWRRKYEFWNLKHMLVHTWLSKINPTRRGYGSTCDKSVVESK